MIGSKCYIVGGTDTTIFWNLIRGHKAGQPKRSIQGVGSCLVWGFVCNGKGYLCGGNNQNFAYYSSLWEYDPQQDLWTQREISNRKRADGFRISIGDKGYVGCGDDSSFCILWFYKYDPITDNWTPMLYIPWWIQDGHMHLQLTGKVM